MGFLWCVCVDSFRTSDPRWHSKIEQDNCFINQHIDNKAQVYSRKAGGDLYLAKQETLHA